MAVAVANTDYRFTLVSFIKIHRIVSNVASNFVFYDNLYQGYQSYGAVSPGTNVQWPFTSIVASNPGALDINGYQLGYFNHTVDNYFYKPIVTKDFSIIHGATGLRTHTIYFSIA